MIGVRRLSIFIECDPSHEIFSGFRLARDFFTNFAGDLLVGIIERLPMLEEVEFDGYPFVARDGPLMVKLASQARDAGLRVRWGVRAGSSDIDEKTKSKTAESIHM